jgi:hypothetical protein
MHAKLSFPSIRTISLPPPRHVSEVLRETLSLKLEERGIELALSSGKAYTFFPSAGVEDVFDAMHKCREAFESRHHRRVSVAAAAFEQDPHHSDGSERRPWEEGGSRGLSGEGNLGLGVSCAGGGEKAAGHLDGTDWR